MSAYLYNTLRDGENAPELLPAELQPHTQKQKHQQEPKYPVTTTKPIDPLPRRKRGLGLFAIGLLIGLLVAGAALGGGLGATLAQCEHNLSSSSSTATSQGTPITHSSPTLSSTATTSTATINNYTVADYKTVNLVYNECPSLSGTQPKTTQGDSYDIDCNRDYANGGSAAEGGVIADIIGVMAYTFTDCMQACSTFNGLSKKWGVTERCLALSFDLDLANATRINGGNCWLKNGTLASGVGGYDVRVMSARLVT